MWIAALAIGALYVGSTALTPLYPLYRQAFGFSPLMVTVVYAVYAVGNLAVLFAFGRLSDQVGRRIASLIAFALTVISAALFLFARGVDWLLLGRAVNGVAAGLGAAALTAWIAELEPGGNRARGAMIASASNLGGLAFGAILAGLLAQYIDAPLRTVFVVYIVILILVALALVKARETVERRVTTLRRLDLHPRIGIPKDIRLEFVAPACMAFASFALGGFFAALIPGLMTTALGFSNVAVIGTVVTLFFVCASLTSALLARLSSWSAMFTGAALVFPGVALLLLAESDRSLALILLASVAAGAAMALSYRGSLQVINEISPPDTRAEVISSYLLMCYLGNSLPVLGVGFLSSRLPAATAHLTFAAIVAGLAILAIIVGTASRGRTHTRASTA
ncbi:MAG TPA: MFS transporter [Steroidobacteraceae bacterium]|nr:MFS transporter [Steroidobacteraceae bacterium]